MCKYPAGCRCLGLIAERDLRQLNVPVAEVAPEKLLRESLRLAVLVALEVLRALSYGIV